MSKRLKPIPKFANEAAERAFWETPGNDSTEYVDWSKATLAVFHELKPSTESNSLRMPAKHRAKPRQMMPTKTGFSQ
jgi:hypothetical protein